MVVEDGVRVVVRVETVVVLCGVVGWRGRFGQGGQRP